MKILTKRFLVSDLFNVNTGSLVSKKRLNELADKNGAPRISVTTDDNGQIGHYNDNEGIPNARYFGNFITVNFFGKVYYHPSKASVEMKVHVLTLKSGKPLTREIGMYLVTVLRKTFDNGSYNYGNQLSSSKIKKGQYYIELPVTPAGEPDFAYMTMRIRELEAERIRELEAYLRVTGLNDTTLSASEAQALTQKAQWKKFKVGDVFDIRKGRRLTKADQLPGNIPFVGSSATDHGVTGYIGQDTIFEGKTLTVSYNGSVGQVFYQTDPYWASDDINVLSLKNKDVELTPEIGNYLVTCLTMAGKGFGYNRKWNVARMTKTDIELPVTADGDIDFDYMQNYIRATEKQTIKGMVEYKDRVIEETKKVVNE